MSAGKRRNSGFTLVEVLVTAALIIVLAALALPTFTAARRKSGEKTCAMNRAAIESEADAALIRGRGETKSEILKDLSADLGEYKCPDGGTYSIVTGADGLPEVSCSIHGQTTDFDSAPSSEK